MHVGGYGGLSESELSVFSELCPVRFFIFGESLSIFCSMLPCRMLSVVMMGKWSSAR